MTDHVSSKRYGRGRPFLYIIHYVLSKPYGRGRPFFSLIHYGDRMEGCSREAMERAARNGHLEVVKLLHQAGAPCSSAAIHLAHVHGHYNIYHLLNALYPGKVCIPSIGFGFCL